MFYTIDGSISDPDNITVTATDIFLMDIGTSSSTNYSFDDGVIDAYDNVPDAFDKKIGHIHSHHKMDAYFSETDMGELHANTPNHNYYLSVVANFNQMFDAKISTIGDAHVPTTIKIPGDYGDIIEVKESRKYEQHLLLMSCNIRFEQDKWFIDRYNEVYKKEKNKTTSVRKFYNTGYSKKHLPSSKSYDKLVEQFLIDLLAFEENSNEKLSDLLDHLETLSQEDSEFIDNFLDIIEENFYVNTSLYFENTLTDKQVITHILDILSDYDNIEVVKILKVFFEKVMKTNKLYNTIAYDW